MLAGLLFVAGLLAYANSLQVPMHFDDAPSLVDNTSLRRLWPLSVPLSPPAGYGLTVEGRPFLNLTLALNYACSGFDLRSYHATNMLIHAVAGVLLFGILRRTLSLPQWSPRVRSASLSGAGLGAGFWVLHPVQTESVTYLIQRAESLAGLCLLLTLYASLRVMGAGSEPARGWRGGWWMAAAGLSSLAGVATKESVVIAPILVLLYDRWFVSGSFRAAWSNRRPLYGCLGATWLLLVWLVLQTGGRGGTFDLADPGAWARYGLTQLVALVHYLRVAFWPHPLVFDHGTFWVRLPDVIPHLVVFLAAMAAVVRGAKRRTWIGFAGIWFLVTLAPSSVVPGNVQMIVEHRMYVPLAAVAGFIAAGATVLTTRTRWLLVAAGLPALLVLTLDRNRAYASPVDLWADSVAKAPSNARAQANLGSALAAAGRTSEALPWIERSLALDANNGEAFYNLGLLHARLGRDAEAEQALGRAAELKPDFFRARMQHAEALWKRGRTHEARKVFEGVLARWPDYGAAHRRLGELLHATGNPSVAVEHLEIALGLDRADAEAAVALAIAKVELDEAEAALSAAKLAVALQPELAKAHFAVGVVHRLSGRTNEAVRAFAESVRLEPDRAENRLQYGTMLAQTGRLQDAERELEQAVRLAPESPEPYHVLGIVLAQSDRPAAAVPRYEKALQLRPTYAEARYNYGNALLLLGRFSEARLQFQRALGLQPDLEAAQLMLDRLDAAEASLPPQR